MGLFYVTLVGTFMVGALAIPVWRAPQLDDSALMIRNGAYRHDRILWHLAKAIEIASPARLAPFFYLQIITALVLSYGMFNEIPDAWALVGMTVIVAAGLVCMTERHQRVATPGANGT